MAVRGQLVAVNSSITWILEVKLRSSDLVAGSSVTEPTKWPQHYYFVIKCGQLLSCFSYGHTLDL